MSFRKRPGLCSAAICEADRQFLRQEKAPRIPQEFGGVDPGGNVPGTSTVPTVRYVTPVTLRRRTVQLYNQDEKPK